jgi:hypothetical protein
MRAPAGRSLPEIEVGGVLAGVNLELPVLLWEGFYSGMLRSLDESFVSFRTVLWPLGRGRFRALHAAIVTVQQLSRRTQLSSSNIHVVAKSCQQESLTCEDF